MKFTVKNVDEKTIRLLANEYVSSSYITLKSLATKCQTTPITISNILWRGIAENIIDQKVAMRIYTKVVNKPSTGWYQRKLRWDDALAKRSEVTRKIEKDCEMQLELDYLNSIKDYYENAIMHYDSYFFEEDEAPSLDSLEAGLAEVKRKISSLNICP